MAITLPLTFISLLLVERPRLFVAINADLRTIYILGESGS
jgi:hypothetical protein